MVCSLCLFIIYLFHAPLLLHVSFSYPSTVKGFPYRYFKGAICTNDQQEVKR